MRQVLEPGSTAQFDVTQSFDATPTFTVYDPSGVAILSVTANSSGGGLFYAVVGVPETEGAYLGQFTGVKTFVGSSYPIVERFAFNVSKTRA